MAFVSCGSSGAAQNPVDQTSEYNYAEIAKYAYINKLFARDDNLAGFWRDCSDIVFRKKLTAQQTVIDGIMKSYEGRETYHKSGSGYIGEYAAFPKKYKDFDKK